MSDRRDRVSILARDTVADSVRPNVRGAPRTRNSPTHSHPSRLRTLQPTQSPPNHPRTTDLPMKALAGGRGTSGLSELRVKLST